MNRQPSSSTSNCKNSDVLNQNAKWVTCFNLLSKTVLYYKGQKDLNTSNKEAFEDLEGETIANYLTNLLGDSTDVINPDLNSVYSIFNKKTTLEGSHDLGLQLFDLKCSMINQSAEDTLRINPNFVKPRVAIINTSGKEINPREKEVNVLNVYGSHWDSLVILPRNFRGPLNMQKQTLDVEQVCFYDSLANSSKLKIPDELKKILTSGKEFIRETDKTPKVYRIPRLISIDSKFSVKVAKQQIENSCGYWALHNALMTIFTGSHDFFEEYVQHKLKTTDFQRNATEVYLRQVIEELNSGIHMQSENVSGHNTLTREYELKTPKEQSIKNQRTLRSLASETCSTIREPKAQKGRNLNRVRSSSTHKMSQPSSQTLEDKKLSIIGNFYQTGRNLIQVVLIK